MVSMQMLKADDYNNMGIVNLDGLLYVYDYHDKFTIIDPGFPIIYFKFNDTKPLSVTIIGPYNQICIVRPYSVPLAYIY